MKHVTTKARLLGILRSRVRPLSASQLATKLNLPDQRHVYSHISNLRKEGINVVVSSGSDGLNRYTVAN